MRRLSRLGPALLGFICCLFLAGTAQAQGIAAWFDPTLGDLKHNIIYDLNYSPDRAVEGQEVDMGYLQNSVRFVLPVWQNSRHEFSFNGRAALMAVNTDAILPQSNRPFPDDLWDLRAGATYRYKLERGWVAGGNLTVGSPSDKPFNKLDDTSINATASLMVPQSKRHYWLFFINYSNTRDFLAGIPIPGAAYSYRRGKELWLLLGLPLAIVRWQPTPKWTLAGTYIYPRSIITRVGYRILPWLEPYVGFDWTYERWFLSDRTDDKDRLFFYQKQIKAGIKLPFSRDMSLNLSGAYAFDRLWFEGNDYDDRDQDRINLENGLVFSLALKWSF
ncbi:MAG: hypothetical protein K9K66_05715 [Desulfarculaceae bacterium]|nr:hypothetical protein [Desulfarculaceae bacterium]MCF8071258.1 hypothetical protein [Desulfarculaceae bacterium]MCF8101139.1 hypothetical protein [Desulfarculaceae bacterium]MCF8115312.1 hypothetical protein [Desulfarculaceae bacterium]